MALLFKARAHHWSGGARKIALANDRVVFKCRVRPLPLGEPLGAPSGPRNHLFTTVLGHIQTE